MRYFKISKASKKKFQPVVKMVPYTYLIDLFFSEKPIDPLEYGGIIADALEVFNQHHYCCEDLHNIQNVQDNELLRPLSHRQVTCYSATIIALQSGDFPTAFHELRDCIHDYSQYRNKEFVSVSEYYLFREMFCRFNIKWEETYK